MDGCVREAPELEQRQRAQALVVDAALGAVGELVEDRDRLFRLPEQDPRVRAAEPGALAAAVALDEEVVQLPRLRVQAAGERLVGDGDEEAVLGVAQILRWIGEELLQLGEDQRELGTVLPQRERALQRRRLRLRSGFALRMDRSEIHHA